MNDRIRNLPPLFVPVVHGAGEPEPRNDAPQPLEVGLGPVVIPAGDARGEPIHVLRAGDVAQVWPDRVEVGVGEQLEPLLARLLAIPGAPAREELLRRIHFNHPGIDVAALRLGDVLDLRPAEPRAPSRRELLTSPIVRREIEAAWRDSFPDDPARRHEEGGWIFMNVATGVIFTHRAQRGAEANIDLSVPVLYVDSVIVATYHTHPHPAADNYLLGPSLSDEQMDDSRGVPGIVRSRDGYHAYGWEQRASLAGKSGYFPGTPERPLD